MYVSITLNLIQKKIATAENTPTTGQTNFWKVLWSETLNGKSIIYHGSSGAPLYNEYRNDRIVGQLHGAGDDNWDCNYQTGYFGKFSISWANGSEPRRRLKEWLDPDNNGTVGIDGIFCDGANTRNITNITFDYDSDIFGCSIYVQNASIIDGANVIFHAADDITIYGEFEVELGSTLQVGTD